MKRMMFAASALIAAAVLPAQAQDPHFLVPQVGSYHYTCSALGGSGCSQPIPDGAATPAQSVVTSSFTIPADAPACPARTVQVVISALHGAPGDLSVTGRHVEPNVSVTAASLSDANATNDGVDFQRIFNNASLQGSIAGTWQLSIEDQHDGDYGQLVDWRIRVLCPPVKRVAAEVGGSVHGVAEPGEFLDYALDLRNDDYVDTVGRITDPLPAGTQFVSADNGGALVGGNVVWSNVPVPARSVVIVHMRLQVLSPIPAGLTQIENQATLGLADPTSIGVGPALASCDASDNVNCLKTTLPTGAALDRASKIVASESGSVAGVAEPGETLTYAIALHNPGGAPQTGVTVVDPLPAGTSYLSSDNGGVLSGGQVTWNALTVPGATTLTLHLTVQVANPIPAGTTQISNQATVNGSTTCADLSALPTCAPTTLPVAVAPGALGPTLKRISSESGTQAGVGEPGEQITYEILVHNTGGTALAGVNVSDPLPAGSSFVSADNGALPVGGNVTWTGLGVPAGSTLALHVTVALANPLPSGQTTLVNQALVNGVATCADIAGPTCTATVIPLAAGGGPVELVPIPAAGTWALLALLAGLAAVSLRRLRRS